jgi:MFS family permease
MISSSWKPNKVFYGWWIVGASFLIALYVGGVVFYGFTAFFEPIADELGWSYTQISIAASLRGLEIGLLAPIVGILADRWGPRRLVAAGLILAAGGLFLMSVSTSLVTFYLAFALLAVGMSGCTLTVLMTTVANWFRRRVGLASGIAISGFGFSGVMVPLIVGLIAIYGWRTAVTILALGMIVVILPLSLLFRHKPEQYGYSPDGRQSDAATSSADMPLTQETEVEIKTGQAFRSGAFWRLALAFMYHIMVVSAAVTHVMPYLSSLGIDRSTSGLVATAIPLASIFGRLGLGWLGDKLDRRLVAAAGFLLMGAGLLCFGYISAASMWLITLFLILFGIGYGGSNVMRPSLGREYFGRANFGAILGLMVGIGAIGSIIGPTVAGWTYDNWGSYQAVWFIYAGLSIVAFLSVLTMSPVKREQTDGKA